MNYEYPMDHWSWIMDHWSLFIDQGQLIMGYLLTMGYWSCIIDHGILTMGYWSCVIDHGSFLRDPLIFGHWTWAALWILLMRHVYITLRLQFMSCRAWVDGGLGGIWNKATQINFNSDLVILILPIVLKLHRMKRNLFISKWFFKIFKHSKIIQSMYLKQKIFKTNQS